MSQQGIQFNKMKASLCSIRKRNILRRSTTLQIHPARRRSTLHTHILNFPWWRGHMLGRRRRPIDTSRIRLRLFLALQARPRHSRVRLDPDALRTRINRKHTMSTPSPASTASRRSAPTAGPARKKRGKRALGQAQFLRLSLARRSLLLQRIRPQFLQLRDERSPCGRCEEWRCAVWAGAVGQLQGAEDETARRAEGRVF